jgi:hypothetical protein
MMLLPRLGLSMVLGSYEIARLDEVVDDMFHFRKMHYSKSLYSDSFTFALSMEKCRVP